MSTQTPTGPHSPVSNEPEGALGGPSQEELASEEPWPGAGGDAASWGDGLEQAGYPPQRAGYAPEREAARRARGRRRSTDPRAAASFGLRRRSRRRSTARTTASRSRRPRATRGGSTLVRITAADNSQWIGTGWFIGPHTLITAGHCVFIRGSNVPQQNGWVRNISVMPGRNGGALPYGAVTSMSFRSVTGWTVNGDQNYDYGATCRPTSARRRAGSGSASTATPICCRPPATSPATPATSRRARSGTTPAGSPRSPT